MVKRRRKNNRVNLLSRINILKWDISIPRYISYRRIQLDRTQIPQNHKFLELNCFPLLISTLSSNELEILTSILPTISPQLEQENLGLIGNLTYCNLKKNNSQTLNKCSRQLLFFKQDFHVPRVQDMGNVDR